MAKTLVIHPERCTACRACELARSMEHHGEFNPSRCRILRDNRLAGAAQ